MTDNKSAPGAGKLRAWLTLNDVSVPTLAGRLKVSRQTVYRWMDGDRPSYRRMVQIERATGIGLDQWSEG